MKKKNAAAIVAASILVMGLTGCGENRIPDMTEAQMEEVGEYVAFTMMKCIWLPPGTADWRS